MIQVRIKTLATKECINALGGKKSVAVIKMTDLDGNNVVRMVDRHMANSIGDSASLPDDIWTMMVQNYRHELKTHAIDY